MLWTRHGTLAACTCAMLSGSSALISLLDVLMGALSSCVSDAITSRSQGLHHAVHLPAPVAVSQPTRICFAGRGLLLTATCDSCSLWLVVLQSYVNVTSSVSSLTILLSYKNEYRRWVLEFPEIYSCTHAWGKMPSSEDRLWVQITAAKTSVKYCP